MSQADRERWNKKWIEMAGQPFSPHHLLVNNQDLLGKGMALDLACGRGQNAIWLAQRGYQVLGVDISDAALDLARVDANKQGLADRVHFLLADLDRWLVPQESFNLICVFRFLDRTLYPSIRDGLLAGGLLFFATRHIGALAHYPEANRAYLLERGELKAEFTRWEILHYKEGPEDAEVIIRKPIKD